MINAISSLDLDTKAHVQKELARRGSTSKGGLYIRYSFLELQELARFLEHNGHLIDPAQLDLHMHENINSRERVFLSMISNRTDLTEIKERMTREVTRTKLAIRRILGKNEPKAEEDVATGWKRVAAMFG